MSDLYAATNIISNLNSRTMGNDKKPLLDADSTLASYESCYRTTDKELIFNMHKMEVTVNLGKSFMVHAIVFVQDLKNGIEPSDQPDSNQWL